MFTIITSICPPYSLCQNHLPSLQQLLHMFSIYTYHSYFTICLPCMFIMITSPYVHHDLFTMYVYHMHITMCSPGMFTILIFTICSPCMFTIITLPYAHHMLSTCSPLVFHNHFNTCSPCIFIRITLPHAHHFYNNYFTICSPYVFIMITSPCIHHGLFTMYVYHKNLHIFTIITLSESLHHMFMFTRITSSYVHHVCLS